ncbi:MAG: hypothetical protein IJ228_06770 [Succinivibrio sp.]|nr:hypothetical protein [Succinivibrio sp.]
MSMTVDNNGNISGVGLNVNGEQLDTTKSIQFIFAQLQNELAKTNKDKALGIIEEIKSQQAQAKQMSELINNLRQTSQDIQDGKVKDLPTDPDKINAELDKANNYSAADKAQDQQMLKDIEAYRQAIKEGKNSELPTTQEGIEAYRQKYGNAQWMQALRVREYCIKNGIDIGAKMDENKLNEIKGKVEQSSRLGDPAYVNALKTYQQAASYGLSLEANPSKDQMNAMIEIMKNKQEQCGTDIQQKMVFVQDYIGQYNAYQQGASTAISQANQTLSTLSRGQ